MIPKIYTSPTCYYCNEVKKYFKEKSIEYREIDIVENEEERMLLLEKTGQMVVPVIKINDEFIIGFDKEKIEKCLKNK